jgi:hypothetical protein
MVMSPMELGTKDDSACEGRLQFTQPDEPNKESMLTAEELLEAVFSLRSAQSHIKRTVLYSGPWLAVSHIE